MNGSQQQTFILTDGAYCLEGVDRAEGRTLMARNMSIFLLERGIFITEDNLTSGNVTPGFRSQLRWWNCTLVSWYLPRGILSHTLAGHCHSGWERIWATLPANLLELIWSDTKKGECLFLSENNVAVVVVGHCENRVALRSSMKIHPESLILHLCTTSYLNGNHLLYTYAL